MTLINALLLAGSTGTIGWLIGYLSASWSITNAPMAKSRSAVKTILNAI